MFKTKVLKLLVNFFRIEKSTGFSNSDMFQAIFLHNGSDINMLGKDVEAIYFSGGTLSVKLQNKIATYVKRKAPYFSPISAFGNQEGDTIITKRKVSLRYD